MPQICKVIVSGKDRFVLNAHAWDDLRFSEMFVRQNPVNRDQAMKISLFLKETIEKMEDETIPLPIIDEMIRGKAMELGCQEISSVKLDGDMFKETRLEISGNAKIVLERRYLRKNDAGEPTETPEDMFRRVAHHIAQAERNYGNSTAAAEMEAVFYRMMTEFRFLPNSPTLMNAGRRLGQLAACFVLPLPEQGKPVFLTDEAAAPTRAVAALGENRYAPVFNYPSPNRVDIELAQPATALLFSDTWEHGWRAWLVAEGQAESLELLSDSLARRQISLASPAKGVVRMAYRPPSFLFGLYCTLIALFMAAFSLGGTLRRSLYGRTSS